MCIADLRGIKKSCSNDYRGKEFGLEVTGNLVVLPPGLEHGSGLMVLTLNPTKI